MFNVFLSDTELDYLLNNNYIYNFRDEYTNLYCTYVENVKTIPSEHDIGFLDIILYP